MNLNDSSWRRVAKSLQVIGLLSCAVFLVAQVVLLAYYFANRPVVPQPERGLTIGLRWTHPVRYGSGEDERRSLWLFSMFFPGVALVAVGEAIKMYKLNDYSGISTSPKLPWNHKWGP
jgi:hypothetical protein